LVMSEYRLIEATGLPESPLDAAGEFHNRVLPAARAALASGADVVLAFAHADHTHKAWRTAMIQELAREAAPRRVNAVAGEAGEDVLAFLACAPGVTGQVLQIDGNLAQNP